MIIIGITGTIGAGKGTIVDYLIKTKGYKHYSVREFLSNEIKKRNMPVNRDSMVTVANDLRAKNSPSYVVDQLYAMASKQGVNCIIESIRTPGEVDSLRQNSHFYLFAVDADAKIRYERIKLRKSETDHIDFKTFVANEAREMTASDPNHQNLKKCIEMANHVLNNNGSREELNQQIENIIKSIN